MKNIYLSVIITYHNSENYFYKLLNSLESQINDKRVEVIFIDDGSTDRSIDMVQAFQTLQPDRIRIIQHENIGIAASRNKAIRLAVGKYIGFADTDDWIVPDMFTRMLNRAMDTEAEVVLCDFYKAFPAGKNRIIRVFDPGEHGSVPSNNKRFVFESGFSLWNKLFHRDLFIKNDLWFVEGILHSDIAISPVLMAHSNKISKVHSPLYFHHERAESSVRSWHSDFNDIFRAMDVLQSVMPSGYEKELEYLVIRELLYMTLPSRCLNRTISRKHLNLTLDYLDTHFPSWKINPYLKERGLFHRLYILLASKGYVSSICSYAQMKKIFLR